MQKYLTVRDTLSKLGYQCECDETLAESLVCYTNTEDVTFKRTCGHEKTVKASYLAKMLTQAEPQCYDCELYRKYSYDALTQTFVCRKCDGVSYEVPRTNLTKFPCLHCCPRVTRETAFFRLFNAFIRDNQIEDCYITRNCQYVSTSPKALCADFKVVYQGRSLLIEIDEISHLTRAGSERHLEKQQLARAMGVPLLRVMADDIEMVCTNEIWDEMVKHIFVDNLAAGTFFVMTDAGVKFYSNKRFGNVFQDIPNTHASFKLLERSVEDILVPEEEEEVEVEDNDSETIVLPSGEEWCGDTEFADALLLLGCDIMNRVEDLKSFKEEICDNVDDKRNEDLDVFIETWEKLAFLILQKPSMDVIEALKMFLTNLTSLLLFQGRKLTLEEGQSVTEEDIKKETTLDT